MKSQIYECPNEINTNLVSRIAVAARDIREMTGVFTNVRQFVTHRCEPYITSGGRSFEQYLSECIFVKFLLIKCFFEISSFVLNSLSVSVENYLLTL